MQTLDSGPEQVLLQLEPLAEAPEGCAATYGEILQVLAHALQLGLFAPTSLVQMPAYRVDARQAELELHLQSLTPAFFTVARGMVEFHREQGAPLLPLMVTSTATAATVTSTVLPPIPQDLPFPVTLSLPSAGRPLVLLVDFADPLAEDTRQQVLQDIAIWCALLCGGYPLAGEAPGRSILGPFGARFLHPTLLEFATESWYAAPESVTPLLNYLRQLDHSLAIRAVELQ